MSYDIYLTDPKTKEVIELPAHDLKGGTCTAQSCTEAWLNITYNYSKYYYINIDADNGIRWLYGQIASDTFDRLEEAIKILGTKSTSNYWDTNPGNAGAALNNLLTLGKMAPYGIWTGD